MQPSSPSARKPWAVKFRSSEGFCTAVVFLSVFVDLFVYSSIIPVIPFRLESLGYEKPSVMTGWLLFAYSLGLVCATPPLAYFAEKYWSRRAPLIVCLLVLIGAQIMFMEAPYYWLMCLARVLQGISSAAVWVVAFAMLCDTVAEKRLGRQLGIVLTALTIGFLIGAPLGGVLNDKLGYRAPFIVGIITCCLDMVGRLLFIEKHEASRWIPSDPSSDERYESENTDPTLIQSLTSFIGEAPKKSHLSVIKVIATLIRSKRASAAFLNTFISGIIFTITEPTLPLRLQDLYGFTSFKVGIIYLSAVVPSLFSTLLSGWATDKYGIEWVAVSCLCASAPWWVVMAMRSHLALLVSAIALANFFFSACVTPFTADLAAAARELDGIGYAHVFGAFNFAYACATAVGPLLGGQIYGHVKHGWTIIMCLAAGLILFGALAAAWGSGERPLLTRLVRLFSQWTKSTPKACI
ncbi:MFS general substrate transporter, partial [Serendipita vermifera]